VSRPLDLERLAALVKESCAGLDEVEPDRILKATLKDLYNGVAMEEVRKCVILAARTLIEKDPAYSFVTARLLLDSLRHEALGEEASQGDMAAKYPEHFPHFIQHGVKIGLLNEALLQYDMKVLGAALKARARLAVRLSRAADALRPLLPRRPIRGARECGPAIRAPAMLFHARRDGASR
jgi:ribonucleoside-diphosphate reductase alpha chain